MHGSPLFFALVWHGSLVKCARQLIHDDERDRRDNTNLDVGELVVTHRRFAFSLGGFRIGAGA
jgi:hypothetical protein